MGRKAGRRGLKSDDEKEAVECGVPGYAGIDLGCRIKPKELSASA